MSAVQAILSGPEGTGPAKSGRFVSVYTIAVSADPDQSHGGGPLRLLAWTRQIPTETYDSNGRIVESPILSTIDVRM
jgi:hypothetical protein